MAEFILYGTSACHLCDIAESMLVECQRAGWACAYRKVDIADSEVLFERYGLLIPVLRHPNGQELNWPFEPQELGRLLSQGADQ